MRLGNLDNLNFGMGLKAKPGQYISAKHANFEGFSEGNKPNMFITVVVIGLIIYLLWSKNKVKNDV